MRKLLGVLVSSVLMIFVVSSFAQETKLIEKKATELETAKVEVYYFHGTRRCETCKAVGKVSSELIENEYSDNKDVCFIEVNYDEEGNEALVEKFEVTSSSLYVYNHEKIINLTTYAFQYAKTNPDKLRSRLKTLINKNL